MLTPPSLPHVAARTILDLDKGKWTPIHLPKRATATLDRVRQGRAVYGTDPFLIAFYGNEAGGRDMGKPLGTVTTKGRHAIIKGNYMRMLNLPEVRREMGFPDTYRLPDCPEDAHKLLGNAVVPAVATWLVDQIRKAA